MSRNAARLRIEGHVQGVGYRWWVVQTASDLGLEGWVRNRRDDSVEVLAIGDGEVVSQLVEACRVGPYGAVVRSVRAELADDDGSVGFGQKATS